MGKTANVRTDWSRWPSSILFAFMYLIQKIETAKGALQARRHVLPDVLAGHGWDHLLMCFQPTFNQIMQVLNGLQCYLFVHAFINHFIGEMNEPVRDILIEGNCARPEAFVSCWKEEGRVVDKILH